ncbi:MAG TPA: hypothetical protein VLY23_09415 [Candidatus Acidoferrum sp.]|nr:hypothetical protein [Candidatus Acidoferrum sp.]
MDTPSASDRSFSPEPQAGDRLDSWKEIAAYLRRDESTVRRWEKDGLPIRRHVHKSRAAVYAYKTELDAWWDQGRTSDQAAETQQPAPATSTRKRLWLVGAALGVALIAVTAGRLVFFPAHTRSASAPLALAAFMNMGGDLSYPAFSPDGKQIAFSWANSRLPGTEIFVKLVGSETPLQLTSNKGGEDFSASWSPDGREIAFLRQSTGGTGVFVISALGGPERRLVSLRPDRYYMLDWSPDGKYIAFGQRASADEPYRVFVVPKEGGKERQVSFPPPGTEGDWRFAFSPDGKYLALLRHSNSPTAPLSIQLMPSGGGEPKMLYEQTEWIGNLAWSADSQSLIVTGNHQGVRKLWRVYLSDGHEEPLVDFGENAYYPAVSKQGSRIAFVRNIEDSDLWSTKLASPHGPGGPPAHVVSSTRVEGAPRFSPDGKRIAFESVRSGSAEIWVSDPDGNNAVQLTFLRTSEPEMPSWSPDGQTIAFGNSGLDQLISAVGGQPRRLSPDIDAYAGPVWSRDGHSIYYWKVGQNEEAQIWKIATAGGHPVQITKNGGFSCMESLDGKSLYFTKRTIPGIWKMPVNGGEETLVMKAMDPALPGYWAVFEDGIYYVNSQAKPQPTIEFYSFATRQSTRILGLSGQPDAWFGGLTVSPDRRLIVFSQQQYQSSEIILGENFR